MTLALADWSALAPCSRQPTAELSSLVREGVGSQLAYSLRRANPPGWLTEIRDIPTTR